MAQTSSPSAVCGRCGATLPPDTPEGLCPQCLLAAAALPVSGRTDDESTHLSPPGGSVPWAASRLGPGEIFGPYRIERLLGRGGMGEVYAAEHVGHGRRVALKILRHRLSDPHDRARFIHEGQLAASLNHPNTVYIFGTEEIAGSPVITMELLAAGTLKDRVRDRGPLAPNEAVDAILQVIGGLDAAQASGILHRDIKPSNCFVDRDGTVKIGDFGLSISTIARDVSQTTLAEGFQGTPQFASPEQLKGQPLDVRADLYAVGATLYYLLTGQPPFDDRDLLALVTRVATEAPPSPRHLQPSVPRGLAALVLRCLAKDRSARPPTYAALEDELRPFSSSSPTPAPLGLRTVAGAIDGLVLAVLAMPIFFFATITAQPGGELLLTFGASLGPWDGAAIAGIWFLYYSLLEGLGDASIGKRLCGLRVASLNTLHAGLVRAAVRTALFLPFWCAFGFSLLMRLAHLAGDPPGIAPWRNLTFSDVTWLSLAVLWLPLLFLPSRRRNGFAAGHDLLTRTRAVMRGKEVPRMANVVTHDPVPLAQPPSHRLDPFDIVGTHGSTEAGELLAGVDRVLRRRVWVHRVPADTAPVVATLRDLARPGRLRWLTGRRTARDAWDAYEAPDGAPLVALAHPQPWPVVKQWLLDLARELNAAATDGSVPRLSIDRVWITRANRALLLDFRAPGRASPVGDAELSPHALLHMVATRAMRGPEDGASVAAPTAVALPLGARTLLSALARSEPASVGEVLAGVTTVVAGSDSVSRWRRAIPIVLGGAPLGVSLLVLLMWLPAIAQVMRADVWPMVDCLMRLAKIEQKTDADSRRQREVLETYVAGRFGSRLTDDALWGQRAFAGLQILRPLAQRALADHPSASAQELASATAELQAVLQEGAGNRREILGVLVAFPSMMLVLATCVGLLSALAFRGGALLRGLGVAIVTRDGAQVSRWRALWRASLTWSPVFLLCLCVAASSLAGRPVEDAFTAPWIVVVAFLAIVVIGAGAVRAVIHPERGWQDELAGTWVVPR